jgi:hypothetical protein
LAGLITVGRSDRDHGARTTGQDPRALPVLAVVLARLPTNRRSLKVARMEVCGTTTWAKVVLEWLRSEEYRADLGLSQSERDRLISNPDLDNEDDNSRRLQLLREQLNRGVIVDLLPPNVAVRCVHIEESDLPKLYIVPTPDWYLDTGRTFLLTETKANLLPGRTMDYGFGNGPEPIRHHEKVSALQPVLANYNFIEASDYLILIADDDGGPYIIIEGTHRATALYRNRAQSMRDNMPWKGLLITHAHMRSSQWHVESDAVAQLTGVWRQWLQQGRLR